MPPTPSSSSAVRQVRETEYGLLLCTDRDSMQALYLESMAAEYMPGRGREKM